MSQQEHKAASPARVRCFVLTVSDTRTDQTDASGRAIVDLLEGAGHLVAGRKIVRDDPDQVLAVIQGQLDDPSLQVVITTGGTGITSRDRTYEAIHTVIEKRLDGFGELFRLLSYQDIGPAAMLSRATAGTIRGRIIVALPGSESAVRLALTKLLLPELGHLVQQVGK